jgi:DNA-binding CsgD family transcriptional regulator
MMEFLTSCGQCASLSIITLDRIKECWNVASVSDLFWQAPLADIKRGYTYEATSDEFVCLVCGQRFPNGVIYSHEGQLYEARKYLEIHVAVGHQSALHYLLNLDKKLTGLTDHQKQILEMFAAGSSDREVAKALGTAASTVRNHRFSLREKQKQAKVFLAIMELIGEHVPKKQTFVPIPRSTTLVDERFAITQEESQEILKTYFPQGLNGPLSNFPLKEKRRVAILLHLIKRFEPNRKYTEKEVNAVLKPVYEDYVLLRRYLIAYQLLDRTPDGSAYWVKP